MNIIDAMDAILVTIKDAQRIKEDILRMDSRYLVNEMLQEKDFPGLEKVIEEFRENVVEYFNQYMAEILKPRLRDLSGLLISGCEEIPVDPDRCEICTFINTSGNHSVCIGNNKVIPDITTHPRWCPKETQGS